jgi:pilus assembly protein CpaB
LKRSNRLVLLVGIFLAVVAFVGIAVILGNGNSTNPNNPVPSAATTLNTVIAAQDIALGVVVKAEMLTTEPKKVDTERKAGAFAEPSLIIGKPTRRKITAGAQLEVADFVDTGVVDRLDVPAGKLAMAIQVDQVSGVGTLIKTGDYVDLVVGLTAHQFPLVTVNPNDQSVTVVAGVNSTSVKLQRQGMQVLGTLLPPPPAAAQGAAAAPAPSGQPSTTLTGGQEMVIVAVDAQQAEVLKFAQLANNGLITLALRSPADFVDPSGNPIVGAAEVTRGITLKTLVDAYGVIRPQLVEAILPAR